MSRLVTEVTTGTKNCAFFFRCLLGSGLCCGTLVYTFALGGLLSSSIRIFVRTVF